jgi:hypothetical protein
MRIRDGTNSDPGSGMERNWIRDKHLGSATLSTTNKYSLSRSSLSVFNRTFPASHDTSSFITFSQTVLMCMCMSLLMNLDLPSPHPSPASECVPPPGTKRGTHSPAGKGVGLSQLRRLDKKPSALSTLWIVVSSPPRRLAEVQDPSVKNSEKMQH